MKKVFFTIILYSIFYILYSGSATAATIATNAATQSPAEEQMYNKLKDRIASRVAELKLVERRGIIGIATEVSDTQITLSDVQNNTRFIDVDELTKFSSPSAKGSFGISDIAKGNAVGILGLYNKQSRRMLGRFIDVLVLPKIINGAVLSVDDKTFTIHVVSENKSEVSADVEITTKTMQYTKADGLLRAGFSKIKEGERIMVVGFSDVKDKNRLIALRIIVFPEIPKNPKITLSAPIQPTTTPQPTTTLATGSAKKTTK